MDEVVQALQAISECRPKPLFSGGAASSHSAAAGPPGGDDHFARLHDDLLLLIISRLPVKDAARTTALSPRWRRLWASIPLRVDDIDLLHLCDGRRVGRDAVAATVSAVLAAHPGPISVAQISCISSDEEGDLVARWLEVLTTKKVEELALLSQPSSFHVTLPASIFSCASLRRLFLGVLTLPTTPDGAGFPDLRELRLCCTNLAGQDLDRVIAFSPALETLEILVSSNHVRHVSISGNSLRRVLLWKSVAEELTVADAPRLERLILWQMCPLRRSAGFRSRVKIGNAPELQVLGYLDPAINVLVIGDTIIKASTKASPRTTVPTVKILALKVRLGSHKEALMVPSFLRCFPHVETLHIMSIDVEEVTEERRFKIWDEVGPIDCVQSHIKKLVFRGVPWKHGELSFLKFITGGAHVLQNLVIVLPNGSYTGMHTSIIKLRLSPLTSATWANDHCRVVVLPFEEGDLSYDTASDLSLSDPFDCSS